MPVEGDGGKMYNLTKLHARKRKQKNLPKAGRKWLQDADIIPAPDADYLDEDYDSDGEEECDEALPKKKAKGAKKTLGNEKGYDSDGEEETKEALPKKKAKCSKKTLGNGKYIDAAEKLKNDVRDAIKEINLDAIDDSIEKDLKYNLQVWIPADGKILKNDLDKREKGVSS